MDFYKSHAFAKARSPRLKIELNKLLASPSDYKLTPEVESKEFKSEAGHEKEAEKKEEVKK